MSKGILMAVLLASLAGSAGAGWMIDGVPVDGGGVDWSQGNTDNMTGIDWTALGPAGGIPSSTVHVDAGTGAEGADGTILRPFGTLQAALDAIGAAADPDAYADPSNRYFRVVVAPGHYGGDVHVPYRPHLTLDLRGVCIEGSVTWDIPGWGRQAGALIPRLVVRGDALRSAYADGGHSVVGIDGEIVVHGPTGQMAQTTFQELHVIHAGVTGGIRYTGGRAHDFGHLFLERADVKGIRSTEGWGGVTLYAHNWGGGHIGGGPAGAGLGPIEGKVLPYNLQNVLVSGGMVLDGGNTNQYGIWHNVRFEGTNAVFDVSGALYGIELDTASYRSWIGATQPAERGTWRLGDRMWLSDPPWGGFLLGDSLFGDGTNLFYVSGDGAVTNQLTVNP